MTARARIATATAALLLAACGSGGDSPPPAPDTAVDATRSSIAVTGSNGVVADGVATVTVTATARNAAGTPLAGEGAVFNVTAGGATLSATSLVTGGDGTATVTVKSTVSGTRVVTVALGGVSLPSGASATFVAGPTATVAFTTQPSSGTAGALGTVAVTVTDTNGNPCPSRSVTLALQGGPVGASLGGTVAGTTDPDGIVSATDLSITKAGTGYQLVATQGLVSGWSSAFSRTAGAPAAGGSTLVATPTSIDADGVASAALAVTVGDEYGNPVQGQAVTLSATGSATVTQPAAATDAAGKTAGKVRSVVAEDVTIFAHAGGTVVAQAQVTMARLPPDTGLTAVVATPTTVKANGYSTSRVNVVVKDRLSHGVPGATVQLTQTGSAVVTPASALTDPTGVASFTVKDATVENLSMPVKITLGGAVSYATSVASVNFVTPLYTVGGTLSGLRNSSSGDGLVLRTAGQPDLTVPRGATTFAFQNAVAVGTPYSVSIVSQPAGEFCSLLDVAGAVPNYDVTSVLVTCQRAFKQVAAGGAHTLALTKDGLLYAWGDNTYGQIGDGGTLDTRTSPVQIASGVSTIGARYYQSFLCTQAGDVYAWGHNWYGQLGVGDTTYRPTPTPVSLPGATACRAIAAGGSFTMILDSAGKTFAMGDNLAGAFGRISPASALTPIQLDAGGISTIAAGDDFSAVITTTSVLFMAGANGGGQLGNGTTSTSATPTRQTVGSGYKLVAGGGSHTLAVKGDGSLWAWGSDAYGQLGNGAPASGNVTTPTPLGWDWIVAISASYSNSFAVRADQWGYTYGWGDNTYDQITVWDSSKTTCPSATSCTAPTVSMAYGAQVAAGAYHVALVTTDGRLFVRGDNRSGQLGTGNTTPTTSPVLIDPP